ncbi:hypothetical protein E2562_012686, partial [Oryza meyeriana var. granulata]
FGPLRSHAAVVAALSTPAPAAEHRRRRRRCGSPDSGGRDGSYRRWSAVAHGDGRRRSAQCAPRALSRLLMVSDPFALADLLAVSLQLIRFLLLSPSPWGGVCSSVAAGPWRRWRQPEYRYNQTKPMLQLLQAASEQVENHWAVDHRLRRFGCGYGFQCYRCIHEVNKKFNKLLPSMGQDQDEAGEYLVQNMITAFLEHRKMKSWIQAGRDTLCLVHHRCIGTIFKNNQPVFLSHVDILKIS